jgi:hypothetical protein
MIKLRRSWTEFKSLFTAKGLQVFYGDARADSYHLLAIDGKVCYECFIAKDNNPDQLDFEATTMPSVTSYISEDPDWDRITKGPSPSNVVDVFIYEKNGAVVQTLTVTYSCANKNAIIEAEKVRV